MSPARFEGKKFPFLFGGAFIEAFGTIIEAVQTYNFPSFSEGLSLRPISTSPRVQTSAGFPFLFGGAFIEAVHKRKPTLSTDSDFPSFSEGLSLRPRYFAGVQPIP